MYMIYSILYSVPIRGNFSYSLAWWLVVLPFRDPMSGPHMSAARCTSRAVTLLLVKFPWDVNLIICAALA